VPESRPAGAFLYAVRCRFTGDAAAEAEWDSWYVSHLRVLLGVPGFLRAQRFRTQGSPDQRPNLALYCVESDRVFTSPEYLAVWGFSAWRASIDRWSRDLLEPVGPDLDFATGEGALLRAAFFMEGPEPADRILGWLLARRAGVKGAVSKGLDRSCAAIAWQTSPPAGVQEPFPEPPGASVTQALYRPLTPCLRPAG
jgi:hypothetical protein